MGIGINKDLEPLVRRVCREGGTVEITGSTHVKWTLPDGTVRRTGLTMHDTTAHRLVREIEAALDGPSAGSTDRYDVRRLGSKFVVLDLATGTPVTNRNGYPQTFGSRGAALQALRELRRVAGCAAVRRGTSHALTTE
jgi:hypothetical protein